MDLNVTLKYNFLEVVNVLFCLNLVISRRLFSTGQGPTAGSLPPPVLNLLLSACTNEHLTLESWFLSLVCFKVREVNGHNTRTEGKQLFAFLGKLKDFEHL